MQTLGAGHVEIGFVDGGHFDLGCEGVENFEYFFGAFPVTLGMSIDENSMRTVLGGGPQRHRGVNSEFTGFVGGRRDYTAFVALAAYHDRFSLQRWIVQFFHRYKECVHIHVENGAKKSGLIGCSHAEEILAASVGERDCKLLHTTKGTNVYERVSFHTCIRTLHRIAGTVNTEPSVCAEGMIVSSSSNSDESLLFSTRLTQPIRPARSSNPGKS